MSIRPITILCVASYDKGHDFMRECKAQGARVLLLTAERLNDIPWPHECIDEVYYLPEPDGVWVTEHVLNAISYVARTENIERIVALDDYDLEIAGLLREHLQVSGIGVSVTRNFRDKLSMRNTALKAGLDVPKFVQFVNVDKIKQLYTSTPFPFMIKPRSQASALGIHKVQNEAEVWRLYDELGDQRSHYVMEQFLPGDVYHVDALTDNGKIVFASASKYGRPPFDVSHGGGIFTTSILKRSTKEEKEILAANKAVLEAMGLHFGASHTEFIRSHADGKFYFLETAARVGGANIVELVEAASGINLWREWAKIELLYGEAPYKLPKVTKEYAGLLISLAKQEYPDTGAYNDKEIVWRMNKKNHVGVIVRSKEYDRVHVLLDNYAQRFQEEFNLFIPAPDKPTH